MCSASPYSIGFTCAGLTGGVMLPETIKKVKHRTWFAGVCAEAMKPIYCPWKWPLLEVVSE